ncbi:type II toxin-antitoxin system VapC family toxin [Candidatus Woesearchaeota archaeon]|nr:type II toxin-antitoxin system VapC family toxin [Candidatus Woesearchaeota archaeon]
MICLDTTFLIDLFGGEQGAAAKLQEVSRDDRLVTTIINASELLLGLYGAAKSGSSKLAMAKEFLERMEIMTLDLQSITKAGEIKGALKRIGKPVNENDLLITGIMLHNGCSTILTRNTKDFERISGVRVLTY